MNILTFYWIKAPAIFVYMLQQVEYDPWKFTSWVDTIPNLLLVQKRQVLHKTKRAELMLLIAYVAWGVPMITGIALSLLAWNPVPLLMCVFSPLCSVLALFFTTFLTQHLVVEPGSQREIQAAKQKLMTTTAKRIAVLGSYGKTTMKELLKTVLSEGKKVAATPGNKNVLISHARWVTGSLKADEDILIFEYGEAQPGDITKLASFSKPHLAVITGLAPAHLDGYPSLTAIADDLASIQDVVDAPNRYINEAAELLKSKITGNYYGSRGLEGLVASEVKVTMQGIQFTLQRGTRKLQLYSGLLGRHQVGPLCAVVAIAFELGLSEEEVIRGVAATTSFEHRMQPYQLNGAWVIDDSYNGNIEGIRAGLQLLQDLPAKRKVYITPGLVDQGTQTEAVHLEMGKLIAQANPDQVVLMHNSVAGIIRRSLEAAGYAGEIRIETDPLNFYTNLGEFIAAGDLLMLQNDWTDNYT